MKKSPKTNDITFKVPTPKFESSWDLTKQSLRIFFKSFWFILAAVLPFHFANELFQYYFLSTSEGHFGRAYQYRNITSLFLTAFLVPVVIYGVSYYLKFGTFPSSLAAYSFGLKKFVHLFGQYFLAGLYLLLGLLLFLFPGLVLYLCYCIIPVVVCFEGSVKKSWLQRSRELTLGKRGLLFFTWTNLLFFMSVLVLGISFFVILVLLLIHVKIHHGESRLIAFLLLDIFHYSFPIAYLLFYLKAKNNRTKKPKEFWFLKWAR